MKKLVLAIALIFVSNTFSQELIKLEKCSEASPIYCDAIGTRAEGWYQNEELVKYSYCENDIAICEITNDHEEGWFSYEKNDRGFGIDFDLDNLTCTISYEFVCTPITVTFWVVIDGKEVLKSMIEDKCEQKEIKTCVPKENDEAPCGGGKYKKTSTGQIVCL